MMKRVAKKLLSTTSLNLKEGPNCLEFEERLKKSRITVL